MPPGLNDASFGFPERKRDATVSITIEPTRRQHGKYPAGSMPRELTRSLFLFPQERRTSVTINVWYISIFGYHLQVPFSDDQSGMTRTTIRVPLQALSTPPPPAPRESLSVSLIFHIYHLTLCSAYCSHTIHVGKGKREESNDFKICQVLLSTNLNI